MATRGAVRRGVANGIDAQPHRRRSSARRQSVGASSSGDPFALAKHYQGEVREWKARFNVLGALTALLIGILLFKTFASAPAAIELRKLNLPRSHDLTPPKLPKDFQNGKNGLLIPAKRSELFTEIGGLYENLTIAHFGWVLQSPFKALNYDQIHRRLNLFHVDARDPVGLERNRADLEEYVQNYLIAPWRSNSSLCSSGTGLFDPAMCAYAVKRFEKQYANFMNERAVSDWRNKVTGEGEGKGYLEKLIWWSDRRAEMNAKIEKCQQGVLLKHQALGVTGEDVDDREFEACQKIRDEYLNIKQLDEQYEKGGVEL